MPVENMKIRQKYPSTKRSVQILQSSNFTIYRYARVTLSPQTDRMSILIFCSVKKTDNWILVTRKIMFFLRSHTKKNQCKETVRVWNEDSAYPHKSTTLRHFKHCFYLKPHTEWLFFYMSIWLKGFNYYSWPCSALAVQLHDFYN